MSRTYKKAKYADDHHDGHDDPTDIRYIGKPKRQPHVPPTPNMQWLPREWQVIDPDFDDQDD